MGDSGISPVGASARRSLRRALGQAESAALTATTALIAGISEADDSIRAQVALLLGYIRSCPDPFAALDVARLLRVLVEDRNADLYSRGSLREWARAELRLNVLVARIARMLADENEVEAEQALMDLAWLHLRTLEESPRYREILVEMGRLVDEGEPVPPRSTIEQFFGLARRDSALPTSPEDD